MGVLTALTEESPARKIVLTILAAVVGAVGAVVVDILKDRRAQDQKLREETERRAREMEEEAARAKERRARTLLASLRCRSAAGDVPLVREVRDLEKLGVSASRTAPGVASGRSVPFPYVHRDRDADLDRALADEPFVLLVGDSGAGKSRSGVEAMWRVFPDRKLLVPTTRDALTRLLDLEGLDLTGVVWWLDDLQNYLGGDGFERLLDQVSAPGARATVLATMRASEHHRYSPQGDLQSPEWKLLRRARAVRLKRKLNEAERARAQELLPSAQLTTVLERFGLGEYLAAGPDLVDRFEDAESTMRVGAAVVHVAVDWQRAGLTRPTPEAVLRSLYAAYVEDPSTEELRPERFADALDWAQHRVYATSALLDPGPDPGEFVAFDYLVDHFELERDDPIPDATWRTALDHAGIASEAFAVGVSAVQRGPNLAVGEAAMRKVIATPGVGEDMRIIAAVNLGSVLIEQGEYQKAEPWLRLAADADNPLGAANLGSLHLRCGDLPQAERWYRRAADQGVGMAARNLARILEDKGQPDQAERWYQQAAEDGDPDAAHNLGLLLEDQDRLGEAEQWYRQAVDGGTAAAAHNLGLLRQQADDLDGAELWYRRAVEDGFTAAATNLGSLLKRKGHPDQAEHWYRLAAEDGDAVAAHNLGVFLEDQGRLDEAEHWYQRAAGQGNAGAARNLGLLLLRQGRVGQAERWYRQAVEADEREEHH